MADCVVVLFRNASVNEHGLASGAIDKVIGPVSFDTARAMVLGYEKQGRVAAAIVQTKP